MSGVHGVGGTGGTDGEPGADGARGTGGVRVRELRPEDHAQVAELILAAYLDGGHLDPRDDYRHELADVAGRAAVAEILVAELPGKAGAPVVTGAVVLAPPGSPLAETAREGEYEFRMLAVHPRLHGRGVGRALVEAVLARARAAAGVHSVVLSTMDTMTSARSLYESLGFRRAPERDWRLRDVLEHVPEGSHEGPFPVYVRPLREDSPASSS
ncbi:N-acetyltransferase [Micrococcus sp.]|uniref:GNAT family N-acetyltransferase n=1 Tax=Micrococcus sp. TaxID=1271 RepID=UPI002A919781|nr:N-acetyltransferase [Micrococcus sp.]MDY6054846.1 N-acetyltransferase [Micrococcus sp.]